MARMGVLILFLILGESIQSFTIKYYVGCGFFMDALSDSVSFFPYLVCWTFLLLWLVFLSWNGIGYCQILFHFDDLVLSFVLLVWCITQIDFCMLNQTCVHEINPTTSVHILFFVCFWIWFASIFLRIFMSNWYWSVVFLKCLSSFDIGNTGLIEWVGKCSLLFYFWKFVKNLYWFLLKYLVEFPSEAVWAWAFLCALLLLLLGLTACFLKWYLSPCGLCVPE